MNTSRVKISSKRLLLLPISSKYRRDIFSEFTKNIATYMFPQPTGNIKDIDDFIVESLDEMKKGTNLQFVALNKKTKEFLGCVGLHNINQHDPEMGIWLKKKAHGKKYGQEAMKAVKDWADKNLNYEHIIYPVAIKNIASRKVAESLGGKVAKEYVGKNQFGEKMEEVEYWIYKDDEHAKTIYFLDNFLKNKKIIPMGKNCKISYFKSGGGTRLYLIDTKGKKYLARVNFYPLKNSWGVKEQEYKILKMIEPIKIAPKVYCFNKNNALKQHFTIVQYKEGTPLKKIKDIHIISLAKTLKKLHTFATFKKSGDTFPPKDKPPYTCDTYNGYANGEDKQIEKYIDLPSIRKVIKPYNRIKNKLGKYFNDLTCFDNIKQFCIVHADLKKENILDLENKAFLIDWECGGVDIPETDIGNLFAGCKLNKKHQKLFLNTYYKNNPEPVVLERIYAIKQVLDFFGIIEDYIILKRKKWDADKMLKELLNFEEGLHF